MRTMDACVRRGLTTAVIVAVLMTCASSLRAGPPMVKKVTDKDIKSLVTRNQGKVVLINYLATWCPLCVAEFPDIVKLDKNYKPKGLIVIGVSINDPSEMKELQAFISKSKPGFPVYLADIKSDAFFQATDRRWAGDPPLTLIYDKSGKLRYYHQERLTYAAFEKDVKPLLQAK